MRRCRGASLCFVMQERLSEIPVTSHTFALLLKKKTSPNQIIESSLTLPSFILKTFWSCWNKRLSLKAPLIPAHWSCWCSTVNKWKQAWQMRAGQAAWKRLCLLARFIELAVRDGILKRFSGTGAERERDVLLIYSWHTQRTSDHRASCCVAHLTAHCIWWVIHPRQLTGPLATFLSLQIHTVYAVVCKY